LLVTERLSGGIHLVDGLLYSASFLNDLRVIRHSMVAFRGMILDIIVSAGSRCSGCWGASGGSVVLGNVLGIRVTNAVE
jgi:hypothetical protein